MTTRLGALLLGQRLPRRRRQPLRRHPHRAQHHVQRGLAAPGGEPVPLGAARGGRDAAHRAAAAHGLRPRGLRAGLHRRPARPDRGDPSRHRLDRVRAAASHSSRTSARSRPGRRCIPSAISRFARVHHYRGCRAGRDPSRRRWTTTTSSSTAFSRIVGRGRRISPGAPRHAARSSTTTGSRHSSAVVGRPLRRLSDRRLLHQAQLRRPGGSHRQRRLLRARSVPGHGRRADAGQAFAARGAPARLRRHAVQPGLRVQPGPGHVPPGSASRRWAGSPTRSTARTPSSTGAAWRTSTWGTRPVSGPTFRWQRHGEHVGVVSPAPAAQQLLRHRADRGRGRGLRGAGRFGLVPGHRPRRRRAGTSAPGSISPPTPARTSPRCTGRRCACSRRRSRWWQRCRARPSAADSVSHSRLTSGWPRRQSRFSANFARLGLPPRLRARR